MKTLRLQPVRDFGQIVGAGTEAVRELLRCEPLMIVRRSGVLLVRQELFQSGGLLRGRLQLQGHARNVPGALDRPLVELWLRFWIPVACEHCAAYVGHWTGHSVRLSEGCTACHRKGS